MNAYAKMRKAAGLTQQEAAYLIGVSQLTISNWEVGRFKPTKENLSKMMEAYKCTFLPDDHHEASESLMCSCAMLGVSQLADYMGIGINRAYELMHTKGFPSIKLPGGGKNTMWLVRRESLERWLDRLEQSN